MNVTSSEMKVNELRKELNELYQTITVLQAKYDCLEWDLLLAENQLDFENQAEEHNKGEVA